MADRADTPVLEVEKLHVYYEESHALQGVSFVLDHGILALVGRNGMGKTTLCNAIAGLVRPRSGAIRFAGREIGGLIPHEITRLGLGFVPQGRRLWPSLTVAETLRLAARSTRGGSAWTAERIYATFPALAERRNHGGGQLSGGEQQMLAIARALMSNPKLLVMDEPTEGLAPVVVDQLASVLRRLRDEGIAVLLVEQNLGVAISVSEQVAIMVNGRINRMMAAPALAADRDLQRRLLGVGRHGEAEMAPVVDSAPAATGAQVFRVERQGGGTEAPAGAAAVGTAEPVPNRWGLRLEPADEAPAPRAAGPERRIFA